MIPASHIVKVTPRVISGGSSDLETNGLLLTKSALIPSDVPAVEFSSAAAVADFFGSEAEETVFAQQYFTGVTNQQKAVNAIVIGRFISEAAPAWVRGGTVTTKLATFKAITDGTLTLEVNGEEVTAENSTFPLHLSFRGCRQGCRSIAGVTGAYDANSQKFTFTTEKTGADASLNLVGVAAVGTAIVGESLVASGVKGTGLSDALGLTVPSVLWFPRARTFRLPPPRLRTSAPSRATGSASPRFGKLRSNRPKALPHGRTLMTTTCTSIGRRMSAASTCSRRPRRSPPR